MNSLPDNLSPGVVIVCGGRDYTDTIAIRRALFALIDAGFVTAIRHGACPTGADYRADEAAQLAHVPREPMPADWSQGKKAGPLRNQAMIDRGGVSLLVAFPGGRGTEDMVRRAEAAGIPVWHP